MKSLQILLVEDDALLGEGVRHGLTRQGFAVDWARNGNEALALLGANDYQAMALDIGLPGVDGNTVLATARRDGRRLPILMLTAREMKVDKLHSFSLGADDYLVKPVDLEELAARLRAMIRRAQPPASEPYRIGDVTVDISARRAWRGGEEVILSGREFCVLEQLISHAGKVLTRRQLEESIYGWNDGAESNTLGVFIHHLRRKLGSRAIVTLRGIGYMIGK